MVAQVKELKTLKTIEKEEIVKYLESVIQDVKEERTDNIVLISSGPEFIHTEILGDMTSLEYVGMLESSKMTFQLQMYDCSGED